MSSPRPTVGIAGLGYMGLATGLGFAERGLSVLGYEVRESVRTDLRRGRTAIQEPGLTPLLRRQLRSGRFRVLDSWSRLVDAADVVFLCLPTPRGAGGRIDLRPLRRGASELGRALREVEARRLVVVKSTVVPGTTIGVVRPLLQRVSGKDETGFGIASNPEFLSEGTMVRDVLEPERIVIGVENPHDGALLREVYRDFPAPVLELTPTGAELVKYASNAFLATKVAFANEISRVAERVGEDVDPVMRAMGLDSRIGTKFLVAGPGFGGSCFEKDVRALVARSRELGVRPRLLAALIPSNDDQTRHAIDLVRGALGSLGRREVAILGVAFKAGTDDVRETRALPLALAATREGARVRLHDPVALDNFLALWRETVGNRWTTPHRCADPLEAVRGADVAVLHSPWPEYLSFPKRWTSAMRRPIVLDLRRALPATVRGRGDLQWIGLGVGSATRDRESGP